MPNASSRLIRSGAVIVVLSGWGCAPERSPTEPSAVPGQALAAAASYTIRDLGTLGGPRSAANAINNAGVIVGWGNVAGSDLRTAFVWKNGVMTNLGTLAGGASEATAINQDGVIVGWSRIKSGDMRAVRWKDGVKQNLGTLGGRNSEARGINMFGVIVGSSETASGDRHAFLWKDGLMTDLGTLGGTSSGANGINRAGVVVGWSTTPSGEQHAFRWKNGVLKDLGTLRTRSSSATAINTRGQIVGSLGARLDAEGEEEDWGPAFLYQNEVMTVVGGLASRPTVFANAISPTGIIVGDAIDYRSDDGENAWVRENGTSQGLPTLLVPGNSSANGINAAGDIVGYSSTAGFALSHAVLWIRH